MSNKIFGSTIQALSRSLHLREQRQNIISANISNADTPNYKAKRLDFEEAMADALSINDAPMARTNSKHMNSSGALNSIAAEVYNNPNNVIQENGNTVDRDAELMKMTENQIMYNAATEILRRKLASIKYAIMEGSK